MSEIIIVLAVTFATAVVALAVHARTGILTGIPGSIADSLLDAVSPETGAVMTDQEWFQLILDGNHVAHPDRVDLRLDAIRNSPAASQLARRVDMVAGSPAVRDLRHITAGARQVALAHTSRVASETAPATMDVARRAAAAAQPHLSKAAVTIRDVAVPAVHATVATARAGAAAILRMIRA